MQKAKDILSKAEDLADAAHHNIKQFLPTIARLFLVSTFLEDGLRMIFQWQSQKDFMVQVWSCGEVLGHVFVIVNMVAQLASVFMVLSQRKIPIAVSILAGVILLQTIAYQTITHWFQIFTHQFMVTLALIGGLVLVYAASQHDPENINPGLPELEKGPKPKAYLQLAGRVLLPLMFLTRLRFGLHWHYYLVFYVVGTILILCVFSGFKTKLSAFVLACGLFLENFFENPFWSFDDGVRDIIKYDFFLTFSVIGGLLLVVEMGPGSVSWDERKKNK